MFDLNRFKQSLAETIAYCTPRLNMDDPKYSLRTLLYPLRDTGLDRMLLDSIVDPVIQIRSAIVDKFDHTGNYWHPKPPLPQGLAGGRLLCSEPDVTVSDGVSQLESNGFIDYDDIPACDTWVYGGTDGDLGRYLIAWIPAPLHPLVEQGMEYNCVECVRWLDSSCIYSFLPVLRAEGLI